MAKRTPTAPQADDLPIAADPNIAIDVRVLEHLRRRGVLDHAEVAAHLDTLADEAEECVEAATRFTTPFADRIPRR